jgi:ubiquinone/menaquinone biosynthesis C-methylase UbiE
MSRADSGTAEIDRIRAEYRRRDATLPPSRDSFLEPATLFCYQQRSRAILAALARRRLLPLDNRTILDVGCGGGQTLIDFETWGASRRNLAGIDLIDESVRIARLRLSGQDGGADIRAGNAAHLPWPARHFDIVSQCTMFTSILSDALRQEIAREMMRVARRGGVILWYDFHVNNPVNDQVRRVGAREIRALFPGCRVRLTRTTLAPPLARRLVPLSWTASLLVEHLKVFNTHYLGVIELPRAD